MSLESDLAAWRRHRDKTIEDALPHLWKDGYRDVLNMKLAPIDHRIKALQAAIRERDGVK